MIYSTTTTIFTQAWTHKSLRCLPRGCSLYLELDCDYTIASYSRHLGNRHHPIQLAHSHPQNSETQQHGCNLTVGIQRQSFLAAMYRCRLFPTHSQRTAQPSLEMWLHPPPNVHLQCSGLQVYRILDRKRTRIPPRQLLYNYNTSTYILSHLSTVHDIVLLWMHIYIIEPQH